MLDMGVEDYLLTSTVNGILAQRLVRSLCPHCREPYPVLPEKVEELRLADLADSGEIILYQAVGCARCDNKGYRGRTAVVELLHVNETIRRLVLQHSEAGAIVKAAREAGMQTMYEDGLRKAVAGHTTMEEVLRVTQEF